VVAKIYSTEIMLQLSEGVGEVRRKLPLAS
jgi:hypothetical protein